MGKGGTKTVFIVTHNIVKSCELECYPPQNVKRILLQMYRLGIVGAEWSKREKYIER